jgi:hypothetical protein
MSHYSVTLSDRTYADEYLAGSGDVRRFSPGLNRLLNALRNDPRAGHEVVVCVKPWREWKIGRLPERVGDPVEIEEKAYSSKTDIEREVFIRRWNRVAVGARLA